MTDASSPAVMPVDRLRWRRGPQAPRAMVLDDAILYATGHLKVADRP